MDTTGPGCNLAMTEALTEVERLVNDANSWSDLSSLFSLCQILGIIHK